MPKSVLPRQWRFGDGCQRRPYACVVVELDDIAINLAAIDGFDPAASYGSTIITVAEPGESHEAFKDGLRAQLGKFRTRASRVYSRRGCSLHAINRFPIRVCTIA